MKNSKFDLVYEQIMSQVSCNSIILEWPFEEPIKKYFSNLKEKIKEYAKKSDEALLNFASTIFDSKPIKYIDEKYGLTSQIMAIIDEYMVEVKGENGEYTLKIDYRAMIASLKAKIATLVNKSEHISTESNIHFYAGSSRYRNDSFGTFFKTLAIAVPVVVLFLYLISTFLAPKIDKLKEANGKVDVKGAPVEVIEILDNPGEPTVISK